MYKKCVSTAVLASCMVTYPLWLIWCLVLIPSPLTYFKPQPQRQSLLLGEKKVLIFGLKYWSGQEPFIGITSKVSQDSYLAWVLNKEGNYIIPCPF